MTHRIIRAADLARTPWKNGGGRTAELAVWPAAAGFDDFGWRLSMADVASDGPFSPFPGIDRTLVLLEGKGLALDVAGTTHRLTGPGAALSFSGDAPTIGTLVDGPVRDFNVMTRRGRFAHAVIVVGDRDCGALGLGLILAHRGPLPVRIDGDRVLLGRCDAILTEEARAVAIEGEGILVRLTAR